MCAQLTQSNNTKSVQRTRVGVFSSRTKQYFAHTTTNGPVVPAKVVHARRRETETHKGIRTYNRICRTGAVPPKRRKSDAEALKLTGLDRKDNQSSEGKFTHTCVSAGFLWKASHRPAGHHGLTFGIEMLGASQGPVALCSTELEPMAPCHKRRLYRRKAP